MHLFVIRHASTAWNLAGRYQGHTDISLSPEGRAEALSWRGLPVSPDQIWVSPLLRARETAELLYPGLAFHADDRLKEMHLGRWEGKTREEILAEAPPEWSGLDLAPHGGETLRQVMARVADWLRELPVEGEAVAITHKMTITALYCLASGWEADGPAPERLRFPRLHRFHWDGRDLKGHALNLPLENR